jgi:SAM-dependent methyltransferase
MKNKFLSLKPRLPRRGVEAWEKWYKKENPGKYVGTYNDKIRNQILINMLRWSKREKGLDMACGEGSLTKAISPYIKSLKAFDISARAIETAKKNYNADNIEYFQKDMKDFTSEMGIFDFILCAEVLYHLEPREIVRVLAETKKSLATGGYFVLTTRTDVWFGFDDFMEMLDEHFTVITIVPVWRPDTTFHKIVKRIFSILSPLLDRLYRSWILSFAPTKPGMCAYVCISKNTPDAEI